MAQVLQDGPVAVLLAWGVVDQVNQVGRHDPGRLLRSLCWTELSRFEAARVPLETEVVEALHVHLLPANLLHSGVLNLALAHIVALFLLLCLEVGTFRRHHQKPTWEIPLGRTVTVDLGNLLVLFCPW